MAIVRIVNAIFQNENSVLTISSRMNGEYGLNDVFIGNPCIINRNGIRSLLELSLQRDEFSKLRDSATVLNECYSQLELNK